MRCYKLFASTCMPIAWALASVLAGVATAADFSIEQAIKTAEKAAAQYGEATTSARAMAFAREVCRNLALKLTDAPSRQRFLGQYNQMQRERERAINDMRQLLEEAPANDPSKPLVEETLRTMHLLRDARPEIDKCVAQRRAGIQPSGAPSTGDIIGQSAAPPGGGTKGFCVRYAQSAQDQQQQNIQLRCGFIGSRWQANYDNHFDWCLRAAASLVKSETKIRADHLKECRGNSKRNAAAFCDRYTRQAQSQQQDNVQLGCGYTGGRWQPHYENHYNWCMRANAIAVNNEIKARASQLQTCRK
jgi:hypothetical protein